MIETRWLKSADGVDVGVRRAGERGPAIIFVHGVGSTAAIWDYQLKGLASRFRCFAVELRGNGAAPDPPPESITRDGFVQDVLTVAAAAGLDHFHLVGCSLGGVVGFELWREAKSRVASLVLADSFVAYPNAEAAANTIIADVKAAGSLRSFAEGRVARVIPSGAPPQRFTETVEQYACKSIPSYIASTYATWTGDYRADLATITAPALVICGELDPIAPIALSREIADGISGAKLIVIPGASHVSNADEPAAFNAALEAFLHEATRAGVDVESSSA